MDDESFCNGEGSAALSPMRQLLFLEGSDANSLAFDIETYSPRGFPYSAEDPVVNFSLVVPLKHKGVLAVSVLAEPVLEGEVLCLLKHLLEVFKGFTIFTYNGSKFDLEYVHRRGRIHGLDFKGVFAELGHLDVYAAVKEAVRLPSYGQKFVERVLGVKRAICDVDGACYHRFFDEFSLYGSLKPMFYNIEDSFGCLRIANVLFRRMKKPCALII